MDRIVRQIHPEERERERATERRLSAYLAQPNIVLLGDPGAGKSHLFREFAQLSGGRYVTARAFLVTPPRARGEILFIDGLDERRAGRGDRDTVDALVEKLFAVAPCQVRISCRAADWLGESDLASLRPYFEQSGEPMVLGLEKLSDDERRTVLSAHGMTADESVAFLREAEERGLDEFLENPQNLIMLLGAVRSGEWPPTRKALFELSTKLMLQEAHPEHARTGGGVYSVDELRPVAGAICAVRLISDVEAVGLADQEGSDAIPSYRSLRFFPSEQVRAALGRRVFVAGPAPESADYAHRTLAEYLSAAWLADTVRTGLPFARLQALIGVDGHPAPELRGLHAWLAVHLPEYSDRLIAADPYGVLTYGDAASLTPSSCAYLIKALGELSRSDPWFRSSNWGTPAIGALSRSDMVEEFRAVIRASDAGFGVRSIVVQALAEGTPLPALKEDLVGILRRDGAAYSERSYALDALLRLEPDGRDAVVHAYRHDLKANGDGLRLRAAALCSLYGDLFDVNDVVQLLNDILVCSDELVGGALYGLVERLSLPDLAAVLDRIHATDREARASAVERRNVWEVAAFYERSLMRVWSAPELFEPARALQWLRTRQGFSDSYSGNRDQLRELLRAAPARLKAMAAHALATLPLDNMRWYNLNQVRQVLFYEISADDYFDALMAQLGKAARGSERESFLYEAAFSAAYGATLPHGWDVFVQLYAMADVRADIRPVRDQSVAAKLPDDYFRYKLRRASEDEPFDQEQQRRDFERDSGIIRSGVHLGWLVWIAKIYLCLFSDLDREATPQARLVGILGGANTQIALEGLRATLARADVPTLHDIVDLAARHQIYDWWYALLAGASECFAQDHDLDAFPDSLLGALLAFDLTAVIPRRRDSTAGHAEDSWQEAAFRQRPELVRDAYIAVARAKFERGEQHVDGLRELLTEEALAPFRKDVLLSFLRDFPNTSPYRLDEMLHAAVVTPAAHPEFLALAAGILQGSLTLEERRRDIWLATAYVLAPSKYQAMVEAVASARPGLIFELRDRTGFERRSQEDKRMALALPQLEFLAQLTGALWPAASHPSGGWSGNTNPWDASDYFYGLVNTISAMASGTATSALVRLEANPQLTSYKEHLLHALANQRAKRREAEYDRPDWTQTVHALDNKQPATVADLHAVLVEHLDDLRKRIRTENTDIYRMFWNIDGYGRLEVPRPEEACRDDLITLLRHRLAPLGISLEPEGHMVSDRRADVSAAMTGRKILCEIKRDYHAEVWTAPDGQLERFYAHDPEARGFGIYLVFWFGDDRPTPIRLPPDGQPRPTSATEMEAMLRARLAPDRAARTAVIVIDVTKPD